MFAHVPLGGKPKVAATLLIYLGESVEPGFGYSPRIAAYLTALLLD